MKLLHTLALTLLLSLSFPAMAGDFCLPTATGCDVLPTDQQADRNTDLIRANEERIDDAQDFAGEANAAAAVALASSTHHFRVDGNAPFQFSFAAAAFRSEFGSSLAIGGALDQHSFGSLHVGLGRHGVYSVSGSINWGF